MRERLVEMLKKISDTYEDFILGVPELLEDVPDGFRKMIEYIDATPNVTSSMICRKLTGLRGIKRNDIV